MIQSKGTLITEFYGRSMQPTLVEGMQVAVEEVFPFEVKPADIIIYKNGKGCVAHRVIRIIREGEKTVFVTKGDNQAYVDAGFIPAEQLFGRVQAAFYPDRPQYNLLIERMAIKRLYLCLGGLALALRSKRDNVPQRVRFIFKPLVGVFFQGFKTTIHFLSWLCKR